MNNANKAAAARHFKFELSNNPSTYTDSANVVNLTALAESYIYENDIEHPTEEEEIFEYVVDWFEHSEFKTMFNE